MRIKRYVLVGCILVSFSLVVVGLSMFTAYQNQQAFSSRTQEPVIILDPGHGGVDGGAVSILGDAEKDINLNISLLVRDLLQVSGYQTVMTRETDVSIHDSSANTIRKQKNSDLHNRLKIIESHPNSLFISIHQNNFTQSSVHGAQMFYSQNNENSKIIAQTLEENFEKYLNKTTQKDIKPAQSNLFLLYNAKSPAVLVECGFLSNAIEAKKLKEEAYQKDLAFVIYSSIVDYLNL